MMTEIEKALLSSFESLQSAHESQLSSLRSELEIMQGVQQTQRESYVNVVGSLRTMFESTQAENRALTQQVQDLRTQVTSLAGAIERLITSSSK
jgi:predicted  nucleic acid-binding Zn-ribbon protein